MHLEITDKRITQDKMLLVAESLCGLSRDEVNHGHSRLMSLVDRDRTGVRAGKLLEIAEDKLRAAVKRYLSRGANADLALRVVQQTIDDLRNDAH